MVAQVFFIFYFKQLTGDLSVGFHNLSETGKFKQTG
jgi:hypothetical protein